MDVQRQGDVDKSFDFSSSRRSETEDCDEAVRQFFEGADTFLKRPISQKLILHW